MKTELLIRTCDLELELMFEQAKAKFEIESNKSPIALDIEASSLGMELAKQLHEKDGSSFKNILNSIKSLDIDTYEVIKQGFREGAYNLFDQDFFEKNDVCSLRTDLFTD